MLRSYKAMQQLNCLFPAGHEHRLVQRRWLRRSNATAGTTREAPRVWIGYSYTVLGVKEEQEDCSGPVLAAATTRRSEEEVRAGDLLELFLDLLWSLL